MNERIERKAAELRREVLKDVRRRHPDATNARQYLHPRYAATVRGYDFQVRGDLDAELRSVDAAAARKRGVITGFLDRDKRVIAVSERYSPQEQRFTGAHELGHLILHPDLPTMHRDRNDRRTNDPLEREANQFAAAYTMPANWVRKDILDKFGECPVHVNDTLAWWLDREDPERFLHANRKQDVDLALALACCSNLGHGHFCSMHDEYGVTAQAMAWRLIDLEVIGP